MARRSNAKQLDNLEILEEACERNRPLELHYYSHSGEFFAAKTRLLGIVDGVLQLDTPQSIGKDVHFSRGQTIEAFLMTGTQIHTFKSKIIDTQCDIKLNQHIVVDGLQISKPASLSDGQRRHDLRVSVAALDDIPVVMHVVGPESRDTSPLAANVYHGRLVNISGGGCGVILDTIQSSKFNVVKQMFLGLTLPEQDTELIFQVEVRSIALAGSKEKATRLGVQFLSWPHQAHLRQSVRPVEQFIAQLQRDASRKRTARG